MRIFVLILGLFASANIVLADTDDRFRLSVDIGITGFLNGLNSRDLVSSLGEDIDRYKTSETAAAPYIGANFHFTDKWSLGIAYQSKRREVLDVYRTSSALEDRITATSFWSSVHTERDFTLNDRLSILASLGVSRSILKGSARIKRRLSSFRTTEVDPIVGIGIASRSRAIGWRVSYLRRFASDDISDLISMTFRIAPVTR